MLKLLKKEIQIIHNHDLHPTNHLNLICQMQKNCSFKE